jgi:hypothetical protein
MRMKVVVVAHRKIYKFLLVFSDKEAESEKNRKSFPLKNRVADPNP